MPWLPLGGSSGGVTVRKAGGADIGTRPRLNLIEGANVTLTVADDAVDDEVDVTIAASGGSSLGHKFTSDTAGAVTLNSTAWAAVHATRARLTLTGCSTGDVIEGSLTCAIENQSGGVAFDFATIVSGAITNRFANATFGFTYALGSSFAWIGSSMRYTLTAGDISSGSVTIALVYKGDNASNRTLRASASNNPLVVAVRNLGPVQT